MDGIDDEELTPKERLGIEMAKAKEALERKWSKEPRTVERRLRYVVSFDCTEEVFSDIKQYIASQRTSNRSARRYYD